MRRIARDTGKKVGGDAPPRRRALQIMMEVPAGMLHKDEKEDIRSQVKDAATATGRRVVCVVKKKPGPRLLEELENSRSFNSREKFVCRCAGLTKDVDPECELVEGHLFTTLSKTLNRMGVDPVNVKTRRAPDLREEAKNFRKKIPKGIPAQIVARMCASLRSVSRRVVSEELEIEDTTAHYEVINKLKPLRNLARLDIDKPDEAGLALVCPLVYGKRLETYMNSDAFQPMRGHNAIEKHGEQTRFFRYTRRTKQNTASPGAA